MREADLPDCEAIAEAVHVAHPEDEGRMAEKFRLFPAGCFVWRDGGALEGYAISHPWLSGEVVPLNAALGGLPAGADTLYLHDLALLPAARGKGVGRVLADRVADLARRSGLPTVSIVAVGGTSGFWEAAGFRTVANTRLDRVLRSYDPGARYMQRPVQAGGRVASRADCSM